MVKTVLTIICLLNTVFFMTLNVFAEDFYSQHAVGWHWYDDPQEKKEEKPKNVVIKHDPNQVVASARTKITTALNKVIAEPTQENLENYLALQEQLNQRAEKVANLWQQVLLKNPEINYALTHPTNSVGIQVYNEKISVEKESALKMFSKQTGLFFFYKSTCPYCQRFAPILKNFAERNGISIIPITMDGISLPEFPNSKIDSGQANQFHVTMTPALFAVNPYTQKAFPVAYGLTSETELRDNIYKIMKQYGGSH